MSEDALGELSFQIVPGGIARFEAVGGVAAVEMRRFAQNVGPRFQRLGHRHGRVATAGQVPGVVDHQPERTFYIVGVGGEGVLVRCWALYCRFYT